MGSEEILGIAVGCAVIDGNIDGCSEGSVVGIADIEGRVVGSAEAVGCVDGMPEGASLCGKAPWMTKSEAVDDAAAIREKQM